MKQKINQILSSQLFLKTLLFLFLFSLFFPIRHVFFNKYAYSIGQYLDFTSFSLYLSDILIVLLALYAVFNQKQAFFKSILPLKWLILWILLVGAIFLPKNPTTDSYFLLKWLEFFVAYGTILILAQKIPIKLWLFRVFLGFTTIQSLIALWQFQTQSFIGLNRLGEQLLSPKLVGFAKIIVNNVPYVRGYGTFPHPNPLSAFLVAGVLISVYFLSISEEKLQKITYSTLILVNLIGLTTTFSRAAFAALFLGLMIYFGGLLLLKLRGGSASERRSNLNLNERLPRPSAALEARNFKLTLIVLCLGIFANLIIFKPFLLSRATITDSASLARIFYAKVGLKMIEYNPVFGVGMGESILQMNKHSPIHLEPWDIQPIHNYFLLAAAELGIIGALILVWIILKHLIKLLKLPLTTYDLLLIAIFSSFLLLMQFDHYFYTLQQTQLLLWVVLGMIAAEVRRGGQDEERPQG